ncbi:hypothetical protein ABPG75_006999 [Micractinium tetrahymenae]
MSGGRGPQRPGGLFGPRGSLFAEFANDPFFAGFGGFFQDPWGDRGGRQPGGGSATAREIPIEGPSDEEREPAVPHRLTGPVIHELPDHDDHLHHDLLFSPSQPDSVQEPDDPSARPYEHHPPPQQQPYLFHPHHQQQQEQQQQQSPVDPLASMGTGPPPHMPSPPRPPPRPPPVRTEAAGPWAPGSGSGGAGGAGGGRATAGEEEPGSPLLVHLAEGMVLSDSSPRFQARSPRFAEQQEVPPWRAPGGGGFSGTPSHAAAPAPQQPEGPAPLGQPAPADWFGGGAAPKQQQQRRRRPSPVDPGAMFVSTPTAQAPAAGVQFASPPPLPAAPRAATPAVPAIATGTPAPSVFWSEPATEADASGGRARRRAGSAPPAGTPAPPPGAAAAAGRRQRRPSSRTLSAVESQAEPAEVVEQARRRHARQARQARRGRDESGLFGSAGDEEDEGDEAMELPEEDPDWRPGQRQPLAGSPPVQKRSRRGGAAAR